ncbi:hypothetical protein [Chryseobacterium gambrini]|uniref:Uncharacterized protein n=1 Tax=Chryseobacterium gambrini TaxID=373672 RepID=A0ABM9SFA0_9FLAO|nr:hypothetical protein CRDW_39520 [Chryseobacterium gambrini]
MVKDKKVETSLNGIKKESQHQIKEFATLEFRRSYVGHENLSERQLKELYNSNPTLLIESTTKMVSNLNRAGLMDKQGLVISKFENKKVKKSFLDKENKLEINFDYYPDHNSEIKIVVKDQTKKIYKTIELSVSYLIGVILKDIDGDNLKEILIVKVGYVVNGDNFDLQILKYQ